MVQIEKVSKHFIVGDKRIDALSNIDLTIKQGEIFAIIGKSGAGKSTLIRCVNLLERPSYGRVIVDGQDLTTLDKTALRQARHNIGMIFQHFNLVHALSVFENVALPMRLLKMPETDITNRVNQLLELVNIADKSQAYPNQLSGGQKQRVAIARALATKPKLLLCDEATSALDPQATKEILKLLKTINQELKVTILLITHEMQVMKYLCDRAAVIDQGEIVEINEPITLYTQPKSDIAKEFCLQELAQDIPEHLVEAMQDNYFQNSYALCRLTFVGESTQQPIIAHLIRELSVTVSILQANIEIIHQQSVGTMLAELICDLPALTQAMKYLHQHNIFIEVLGYVANDVT